MPALAWPPGTVVATPGVRRVASAAAAGPHEEPSSSATLPLPRRQHTVRRDGSFPIGPVATEPPAPHRRGQNLEHIISSTFTDLGVPAEVVAHLSTRGITTAFPIQEQALPPALEGRDVSGRAPTGSGKTLAFVLPLA